ncbi:MAG: aminoglycoside phosphotransferase family protein [Acidobacteriota bacterium]|nr:aminoglycoside phosphotransferase family protein [Acidobacteriota bacterium]
MPALHDDEIEIGLPLVRRLVDATLPHLAGRPLRPLGASGSTNALFRLGDDLLVRLPRQPGGSTVIDKEARWLPHVAASLPVAVPEFVAVGEPGLGYPERWSVVHWTDGATPAVPVAGPHRPADGLARDLANFVRALGDLPVPPDALTDPALRCYRGESLAAMDATAREYLAECRQLPSLDLDLDACLRVWEAAMAMPGSEEAAPRWLHGDLLAENLLVRDGRLAAVLDFGGLSIGDPTVDLIVAWEVLDHHGRELFRSILDVDEATWRRGRAWALLIGLMTFPYYWHSMPERCAARLAMAHTVLADAAPLLQEGR